MFFVTFAPNGSFVVCKAAWVAHGNKRAESDSIGDTFMKNRNSKSSLAPTTLSELYSALDGMVDDDARMRLATSFFCYAQAASDKAFIGPEFNIMLVGPRGGGGSKLSLILCGLLELPVVSINANLILGLPTGKWLPDSETPKAGGFAIVIDESEHFIPGSGETNERIDAACRVIVAEMTRRNTPCPLFILILHTDCTDRDSLLRTGFNRRLMSCVGTIVPIPPPVPFEDGNGADEEDVASIFGEEDEESSLNILRTVLIARHKPPLETLCWLEFFEMVNDMLNPVTPLYKWMILRNVSLEDLRNASSHIDSCHPEELARYLSSKSPDAKGGLASLIAESQSEHARDKKDNSSDKELVFVKCKNCDCLHLMNTKCRCEKEEGE